MKECNKTGRCIKLRKYSKLRRCNKTRKCSKSGKFNKLITMWSAMKIFLIIWLVAKRHCGI